VYLLGYVVNRDNAFQVSFCDGFCCSQTGLPFCVVIQDISSICGRKFRDDDDVIGEVKMWRRQTPENFYRKGMQDIVSRWHKAIEKDGDYAKK
jgi:hypothetical protein